MLKGLFWCFLLFGAIPIAINVISKEFDESLGGVLTVLYAIFFVVFLWINRRSFRGVEGRGPDDHDGGG